MTRTQRDHEAEIVHLDLLNGFMSLFMGVLWHRWAWVLLAASLFLGTAMSWTIGDNQEQYTGFLVFLGWVLLGIGIAVCRKKPSAEQLSSMIDDHGSKVAPTLFVFVLLYAFAGDVVIFIAPSMPYGYAWKYGVPASNVQIQKQPYDCEWQSAPLGAKHCHYEARILTVRTKTAEDGSTALISFDEGQTWAKNTEHTDPSVFVAWAKVEE